MTDYSFHQKLEDSRTKVFSKKRRCLVPGCNENTINSHVFQEKRILKEISKPDGHFYSLRFPSVFTLIKESTFKLTKVGIDKGYSFPGFCKYHDEKIFLPIEKTSFDPYTPLTQSLFTYRTLSLELRKKEIALETTTAIAKIIYESKNPNWLVDYCRKSQEIKDYKQAIQDLIFFKSQLEAEIFDSNPSMFNYSTIQLPHLEVCISTPLNIYDPHNKKSNEIDEYGFDKEIPLATSVLNFFPYNNSSFLICANHKNFSCDWTSELLEKLKNRPELYFKLISDLITFRCEFWAISQNLFNLLSPEKVTSFEEESFNCFNSNYHINSQFNLFEELKSTDMSSQKESRPNSS